ncbi:MAG TPA: glucose-6-phosphate dehydrogenase [bacterium]|nr:glucose-6-phosphate dehydrogenase [bacterium]
MDAVTLPLGEARRSRRAPDPCVVVIFGATGDLAHKKLVPALYRLARLGMLPDESAIVGFARRPQTDEIFRAEMAKAVLGASPAGEATGWDGFARRLHYIQAGFQDGEGYARLRTTLERLDRERGTAGNRLYYLATAPEMYGEIVQRMGEHRLVARPTPGAIAGGPWTRVIVEKPFGRDLASAQELNRTLLEVFRESQIFRIDHYLGKETVQNILVFRFANGIFEPIWNQHYVDHVQISVAETVGIEGRAGYYETAGVVRDIIQSHMMQLLTLMAMESPVAVEPEAVRSEKVKVLRAARRIAPDDVSRNVVFGQYGPGSIDDVPVPGYREEPRVAPDSRTPTFVAMRLFVDNWRWAGVPFYLRSGKRLPKRVTEVAVQFKRAPLLLFGDSAANEPNLLVLNIQPDEVISLRFVAKVPGMTMTLRPVHMGFRFGTAFGGEELSAYERLLVDCLLGDSTLFTRRDEVEEAWDLMEPILRWWEGGTPPVAIQHYAAGMEGPDAARALIGRQGRRWRPL